MFCSVMNAYVVLASTHAQLVLINWSGVRICRNKPCGKKAAVSLSAQVPIPPPVQIYCRSVNGTDRYVIVRWWIQREYNYKLNQNIK